MGTSRGALIRRQRRSAIARSWKAMRRPFWREAAPLVTRWRRRTVAKGDVFDSFCSLTFAKVYTSKMPITACDLLYEPGT
jgi:hypothetical protein